MGSLISVVLGLQFGDEGKGKITDFLSDRYDVVVRFNGGGNAGHTVVNEGKTYKFHLLPSGSLRAPMIVLGNGMVIDPSALISEMESVENLTARTKVVISRMAHIVTPLHKALDSREEQLRGRLSIGTTAQGIGPTYEDKYARTGIRMIDLLDRVIVGDKIETIYRMKEKLLSDTVYSDPSEREKMADSLFECGKKLSRYFDYSEDIIYGEYRKGKNIIFEGAQGTMLDIDFGMYPYVTSSNALAGALSLGAGFPFRKVDKVIGVVKSYVSRVGSGPFPTEISGDLGNELRELGGEYGTTTGRPRRVGWLDLSMLKYAIRINDVDIIALTKLDTLGQMSEIKVCTGYMKDSISMEHIPRTISESSGIELVYKSFKPWGKIDISADGTMNYKDLPVEARSYVEYLERELGVPVSLISMGKSRKNTIEKEPL